MLIIDCKLRLNGAKIGQTYHVVFIAKYQKNLDDGGDGESKTNVGSRYQFGTTKSIKTGDDILVD